MPMPVAARGCSPSSGGPCLRGPRVGGTGGPSPTSMPPAAGVSPGGGVPLPPPPAWISGSGGTGGGDRGDNYTYDRRRPSSPARGDLLLVCRVFKQGQHVCSMSAKFILGDPTLQPPARLDVNQRANLERLQSQLWRGASRSRDSSSSPPSAVAAAGGGAARFSVWQMGADSRADSREYDRLCDYFIGKQRVGLLENTTTAIYMVPPNPKYIHPLGLPDSNFMYAFVISKSRETRAE